MKLRTTSNELHPDRTPTTTRRGCTALQFLASAAALALVVTGSASLLFAGIQAERSPLERTEALKRIKGAGMATLMYAGDYDDDFPFATSTAVARSVLAPYARTQDVFHSPTKGGDFRYNVNIGGVTATAIEHPDATPLWYEVLPGASMPVVAYADGHAKVLTAGARPTFETAIKRKFPRRKGTHPIKL